MVLHFRMLHIFVNYNSDNFFPFIPMPQYLQTKIDYINSFIINGSLGIFCSAIVVIITYTGAYQLEKRKITGQIKFYCTKYIAELSNLITLITQLDGEEVKANIPEIIEKIKYNSDVHNVVNQLVEIHDERLLAIDGFYPFMRKNTANLEIYHLICRLAKINASIQFFDSVYKKNNNHIYAKELDFQQYSDGELLKHINVILQINNDDYEKFINLYKKQIEKRSFYTVFNTDWEERCP